VIPLGYCTIDVAKNAGRKFCFEIVNGRFNDEKDYVIQAATEEEMVEWVTSLRAAKLKAIQEKYKQVKGEREKDYII
jgi:hypothetical protein